MKWIDYPTDTGWWWRKQANKKPELCCVTTKGTSNDDIHIAIFPEKESYIYLEILPDVYWQQMKSFDE